MGGRLIETLCERGYSVKALARSQTAEEKVSRAGAEPVKGDISSVDRLTRGMEGCEVVFHAAALLDVWGRYEEFYQVNVVGTQNVIKSAKAAGVSRVVYVSAGAVLVNDRPVIDADETWPKPKRPFGAYASTKAIAENLLLEANSAELTTVAVRPPAIWGKGDPSFLPVLAESARKGLFVWIDGGRYLCVTCHVDNVCEGAILAAERGRGGEAYFLTDGDPIELRDFWTGLLRTQGVEPTSLSVPRWAAWAAAALLEKLWHMFRLKGRPPITREIIKLVGGPLTVRDDKARRELGYTASMTREKGLAELAGD